MDDGVELPRRARYFLLSAIALLAIGCGYVGDPLPPLANVPARVADLDVSQRASRILVRFTVPTRTTEGFAIRPPLKFDLRIGTAGAGPFDGEAWAAGARQVEGVVVENGGARVDIPSQEWTGRDVTLAVRVIGANGKQSDWSNYVNLAVVPPPEKPTAVSAEATRDGVRLSWRGRPGTFRIFRRTGTENEFTAMAVVEALEWLDSQSEIGRNQVYRVQRIVKTGEREAESELSDEAAITPRDTFAPATPRGISTSAALASIELTWQQNTEPDLAGYRIYRSVNGGEFERVAEVSQVPAFSDTKVEQGKIYRYAVTAFDHAGNEGERSTPVQGML
jgi:hypothetical protein